MITFKDVVIVLKCGYLINVIFTSVNISLHLILEFRHFIVVTCDRERFRFNYAT